MSTYHLVLNENNIVLDTVTIEDADIDSFVYKTKNATILDDSEYSLVNDDDVIVGYTSLKETVNKLKYDNEPDNSNMVVAEIVLADGQYYYQSELCDYPSWSKDADGLWQPPVAEPEVNTDNGDGTGTIVEWDEDNTQWVTETVTLNP